MRSTSSGASLLVVMRVGFVAVVCASFGADLWLIDFANGGATAPVFIGLAVLAGAGVLVAVRQSLVVPLAVVAAAASLWSTLWFWNEGLRFGLFLDIAILPVMFAMLLARGDRRIWPLAAVVALVGEAIGLRSTNPPIQWILVLSMLVVLGVAASAVAYVGVKDRERKAGIEIATTNERLEMARELHDLVGHHVTGIIVLAQGRRFAGSETSGDPLDPSIDATLRDIEAAGVETMNSVRRLVGMLRSEPNTNATHDLSDVEAAFDELRKTHAATDLAIEESLRKQWVTPDLGITVQRVVREATTNVRRHGDPDAPVHCEIGRSAGGIVVEMTNGVRAGAGTTTGYGLVGLRERVEAIGGTFTAHSNQSGTWRLRATLPDRPAVE